MILVLENNIRGGISSVLGHRYVKSDENKKILNIDANNLYSHSVSQPLPYDKIKFEKYICLNKIINTPDDNDIGYFSDVDLSHPYNKRQKTKHFSFCPEKKSLSKGDFSDYVKKIKPRNYIT